MTTTALTALFSLFAQTHALDVAALAKTDQPQPAPAKTPAPVASSPSAEPTPSAPAPAPAPAPENPSATTAASVGTRAAPATNASGSTGAAPTAATGAPAPSPAPTPAQPPGVQPSPAATTATAEAPGATIAPQPLRAAGDEPSPVAEPEEEEAPAEPGGWQLSAFVDSYASLNWGLPKPQTGMNATRAFDVSNGFALAWAGADLAYDTEVVGGTASLRFGPSAAIFSGEDTATGLNIVQQGYATWRPAAADGKISLDLGKFTTLYGAEVAESQDDMTYTRGALNWLGQPFHHTGLRLGYAPTDRFSATVIAVNGWNNSLDNNAGKSFGVQFGITPSNKLGVLLGYIGGPEGDQNIVVDCDVDTAFDPDSGACNDSAGTAASSNDIEVEGINSAFRHFADLVVSVTPNDRFSLLLNADLGVDAVLDAPIDGSAENMLWWGVMASARHTIGNHFAAALRGEYYVDRDDYTTGTGEDGPIQIMTGTLTFEYSPVPELIFKLDNRIDAANVDMFPRGEGAPQATQFTSTLGLVVRAG